MGSYLDLNGGCILGDVPQTLACQATVPTHHEDCEDGHRGRRIRRRHHSIHHVHAIVLHGNEDHDHEHGYDPMTVLTLDLRVHGDGYGLHTVRSFTSNPDP